MDAHISRESLPKPEPDDPDNPVPVADGSSMWDHDDELGWDHDDAWDDDPWEGTSSGLGDVYPFDRQPIRKLPTRSPIDPEPAGDRDPTKPGVQAEQKAATPKFCWSCGAANPFPQARFCHDCAASFEIPT